jgi:cytochrome c oxidase subunit IV
MQKSEEKRKEAIMRLRWSNVLGFVMLAPALLVDKAVFLYVRHNSMTIAIAYVVVGLCLSSWRGAVRQHT